jgi:tRNA threonylcarbamoyladenosine biosynthesis protein TsaE
VSVEWSSGSAEETRALGARLGAVLRGGEVVLLCGDLGVGKTQFAQGVARALGVQAPVVSPTFTLAVHYEGRVPLVHYDLYRVAHAAELDGIGFLEADDPRTVSLVEWGDRVQVPGAIRVTFHMRGDGVRQLVVEGLGPGVSV